MTKEEKLEKEKKELLAELHYSELKAERLQGMVDILKKLLNIE